MSKSSPPPSLSSQLSVSGHVDLASFDSRATTGFDGKKKDAAEALAQIGEELDDLQEKLFAGGRSGTSPTRVLLVLQGMDTSGKGGIVRHVAGLVDPQGLSITSYKKPTPEELEHDFLWRIENALPEPGMIGIFDRSHYEDVLIGKVRHLADQKEIDRRYIAINDFERSFKASGGVIVKCFLHITADDQKERLVARLDDPTKHWKYNPADLDERALWDDYQAAYAVALERCSTGNAAWHVVPSGRKWYRNWAVATLLLEQLRALDLQWPEGDFDVDAEKARLAAM
jgi:PPK2 family polyphosphate:nucleotide phosphotransferase